MSIWAANFKLVYDDIRMIIVVLPSTHVRLSNKVDNKRTFVGFIRMQPISEAISTDDMKGSLFSSDGNKI